VYQPLLPPGPLAPAPSDTVDVADVARTVRRQWRAVLLCLGLGLAAAAAVVLFAPKKFDGKATVLARSSGAGGGSIAGRLGTGVGELLGSLGGGNLGGGMETELQMLKSRALTARVVDSLRLQVRVREPEHVAPAQVIDAYDLVPAFARRTYELVRQSDGSYRAAVGDSTYRLQPGVPGRLDVGTISLAVTTTLPERLVLTIMDREEAVDRVARKLTIAKAGGEIAKVVYRGDDSLTAAAGANALVKFYLDEKKTLDRGVNARRVEYVSAQLDSTARALRDTERQLRQFQEASGVFIPEVSGELELESSVQLRRSLTDLQVEEGAMKQLVAQAASGRVSARDVAAYPGFYRASAVGPLAQQLSDLEAQRIRLLERRTERDPEVQALDQTMRLIETNIANMARSYASGVSRQREQLQVRLDSVERAMRVLPAAAERGGRLIRDVERQTKIYTALEAQLIEARLGTIGEGGEMRQIDVAYPPRKAAFPQPLLTFGLGGAGGLMIGFVAALLLGWFGRWLRDPVDIERAVGVHALRFEPNSPLLLGGAAASRSLLVVPLDARARPTAGIVAERLVQTARQRAIPANIMDLSAGHAGNGTGLTLQQIDQGSDVHIVQLPELTSDVTLSALRDTRPVILVAPPGPVDRTRLAQAVDTLRRLQVPCAGIVISDSPGRIRSLS
jgi:uncharacterized protein involved in exopolysaccharide biosynthesis